MLVTGDPSPDITGTFTYTGQRNGYPYWRQPVTNFDLYYLPSQTCYVFTDVFPAEPGGADNWFLCDDTGPRETYSWMGTATGNITVTTPPP